MTQEYNTYTCTQCGVALMPCGTVWLHADKFPIELHKAGDSHTVEYAPFCMPCYGYYLVESDWPEQIPGDLFTPGPWTFAPQDGTPGHCEMAQVWRPNGKTLADIEPTEDEKEATANARLIAAAPDMLAALREAKRMYEDIQPAGGWQGVYESIESAINKATKDE